jgi:hypothetical protein
MNKQAAIRVGEVVSEGLVVASVAWTGLVTAFVLRALTQSLEGDQIVLDYVPEIAAHATVMNISIPVGALAVVATIVFQCLRKKWRPGFLVLGVASMLAVSTTTVMVWNHMDRLHGDEINLWEYHVWWR